MKLVGILRGSKLIGSRSEYFNLPSVLKDWPRGITFISSAGSWYFASNGQHSFNLGQSARKSIIADSSAGAGSDLTMASNGFLPLWPNAARVHLPDLA